MSEYDDDGWERAEQSELDIDYGRQVALEEIREGFRLVPKVQDPEILARCQRAPAQWFPEDEEGKPVDAPMIPGKEGHRILWYGFDAEGMLVFEYVPVE